MLNGIWAGMILIGIIFGTVTQNMQTITDAALESAKEAISLCITMLGVMAFWVGLMEIAKESGVINNLTRKIRPFLDFMFPTMPEDHPARTFISTNIVANILGLGWAATPAGLKAMEELARGNVKKGIATDDMCTFLILNISSLQIIPIHVIAYRSQYGSVHPVSVVGPAIVATAISTAAGILFCKGIQRTRKRCI